MNKLRKRKQRLKNKEFWFQKTPEEKKAIYNRWKLEKKLAPIVNEAIDLYLEKLSNSLIENSP